MSLRSIRYLGGGAIIDHKSIIIQLHYVILQISYLIIIIMLLKCTNSVKTILAQALHFNFNKYSGYSLKDNKYNAATVQPVKFITDQQFKNYFQARMSQIDQEGQKIIIQMKNDDQNKHKLEQLLDSYLDYSKTRRTPAGLLMILTAVWEYKGDEVWRNTLIKKISQFILRSYDISVFRLDRKNFSIVVNCLCQRLDQSSQKQKIGFVKVKLIELITSNIDVLRPYELTQILAPLNELANSGTMSEKLKFFKLADIIQQKLYRFFLKVLRNETSVNQNNHLTLYNLRIINSFYKSFTPKQEIYSQSLYKILQRLVFNDNHTNRFSQNLVKTRAYSFYYYFTHFGRNKNGQYYRDLLLRKILQKKNYKVQYKNQQIEWQNILLCYNIACFSFFKMMDNVQFRYHQHLNYLIKQDIITPQLDSFFWQYYSQKPERVHTDAILCHIVKNVYPLKYVETPSVNANTIMPSIPENQFKIRLEFALQKLGVKYQSQANVCQRYVDFLIDENIILQCDGLYHFETHVMQYSQASHFRNAHFILAGYKLVIINIYEYTKNRYIQDLSALVKSKLDLIKTHNAIIVI